MAGGLWQFTFAFGHQKKLLVDIRTFLFVFAPFSCRILLWDKYNYCKEFAEFCILKQKLKMNKFLPFFHGGLYFTFLYYFLVSLIFTDIYIPVHLYFGFVDVLIAGSCETPRRQEPNSLQLWKVFTISTCSRSGCYNEKGRVLKSFLPNDVCLNY